MIVNERKDIVGRVKRPKFSSTPIKRPRSGFLFTELEEPAIVSAETDAEDQP